MLKNAAWLVVVFSLLSMAIEAEPAFNAMPKFEAGALTQF
jgi:hypothetical protein